MGGFWYEVGRTISQWDRVNNMSEEQYHKWKAAEEKRKEKEEKARREAYKRAFGVYPEQTWRW